MSLTRADLEARRFQTLMRQAGLNIAVLSDAELQQSIEHTLQQRPDHTPIWIWAYGSLIWNPIFHFDERRVGVVEGWHRQFCLWTPIGRGTPENPGLVLGLEEGQSCQGIVYQLSTAADAMAELTLLWRREMIVGSYIPHWVPVQTAAGMVEAIAFTINHAHPMYTGPLMEEVLVRHLATAEGILGSCADYLSQTVDGLKAAGIEDRELFALHAKVMAQRSPLPE